MTLHSHVVAISAAIAMAGCADAPALDHGIQDEQTSYSSQEISTNEIMTRAREWVADAVPYCGGVRGGADKICGGICVRPAASWDAFRSDCSGYVSWSWQIADDPATATYIHDRAGSDGWTTISIDSLQSGDALVTDGHIKLFSHLVNGGSMDILEEYDCGRVAHEVVQNFTRNGQTLKFSGDGRTYHAIRRNELTDGPATAEFVSVSDWGPSLEVFGRGAPSEHVFQAAFVPTEGGWHDWFDLGGLVAGPPVAVVYDSKLHLFAVGAGGQLFRKMFDGGWHDWEPLGGGIEGTPAVVEYNHELHIFARAVPSNHVFQLKFVPGQGWTNWLDLGGVIMNNPVATVYNKTLQVFAVGSPDRHVYQNQYTPPNEPNAGWTDWIDQKGEADGSPAIMQYGPDFHVFVRGMGNNSLFQKVYRPNAGWTADWIPHQGSFNDNPVLINYQEDLHVFVRGTGTNHLYQHVFNHNTGQWAWLDHGGVIAGPPAVFSYQRDLHIFAVGAADHALFQKVFDHNTGQWRNWDNHGGVLN